MGRRGALLFPCLACAGCIAPSVLESDRRAVAEPEVPREWRPATAADLEGLFESVRIEGEAAASLWLVAYHFSPDGTHTGAALVFDGTRAAFQTLSGTWTLREGVLLLSGDESVRASVAEGHLRLEGEEGVVVLRRVPLR